jgi:hypothetical protein
MVHFLVASQPNEESVHAGEEESMRVIRILSGAIVLLTCGLELRADPAPYNAMIAVSEVEVSSGPSAKYYPTSKLHRGDQVQVVGEEQGWLAIKPPMPESFSWVDGRALDHNGSNATVTKDGTPIRIGSRLLNQPPTVVARASLKRGTQLTILGKAEVDTDGTPWLPILPAVTEVRYIPASAVAAGTGGQQVVSAPPTNVPPTFAGPKPVGAPSAGGGDGESPLLKEARIAEDKGNYLLAAGHYEELSKQVVNHDLALSYLNYAQQLRNRVASNQQVPGRTANTYYPQAGNMDGRMNPVPATYGQPASYVAAQPGGLAASQYCYVADACQTVRLRTPSVNTPTSAAATPSGPQAQWYGPGRLDRTPFSIDGKPAYRLWTGAGQAPLYLTVNPSVDLRPYLDKDVQLYGPLVYRGDLRTHYMVALQVHPVQQ